MSTDVFGYATVAPSFQEELVIILHYFIGVFVLQVVAYALTPKEPEANSAAGSSIVESGQEPWKRLPLAHLYKWLFINPIIVYWGVKGTLDSIWSDPTVRISQVSAYQISFIRMYVALQIVGSCVEASDLVKWKTNPMLQVLMLAHHIFSMAAYMSGIFHQRWWFYATMLGTSEMSTVFLNGVVWAKHPLWRQWFEENCPIYLKLNGLGLWLTFIVFRLLQFPLSFFMFLSDQRHPAAKESTDFEFWFYSGCIVGLFGLSAHWFVSIHRGMLKALGLLSKSEGEHTKAKAP